VRTRFFTSASSRCWRQPLPGLPALHLLPILPPHLAVRPRFP